MPREKKYLKPKKDKLLVKMGRKEQTQTVTGVMADMEGGEKREGDLWKKKYRPDYIQPPDNLDADGLARRRAMVSLLTQIIMPNSLSSKSTAEMDKRSFVNKLNKSTFVQIKRLIPDRIKRLSTEKLQSAVLNPDEILDEEKVEMQNLYMDISL